MTTTIGWRVVEYTIDKEIPKMIIHMKNQFEEYLSRSCLIWSWSAPTTSSTWKTQQYALRQHRSPEGTNLSKAIIYICKHTLLKKITKATIKHSICKPLSSLGVCHPLSPWIKIWPFLYLYKLEFPLYNNPLGQVWLYK